MDYHPHSPVRPARRRSTGRRPLGFTLTELLVVISIIAVLAALATYAAINAMKAANRATIKMEIGQIAGSLEDFKNDVGAYPPSTINNGGATYTLVRNDMVRMFKKMYPRHKESTALLEAICGSTANSNFQALPNGLRAGEAVYFWLGGFSDDPEYPISGRGGPSFADPSGGSLDPSDEVIEDRNRRYEFDISRLGPRDDSGQFSGRSITYPDPRDSNITRQINFWQYVPKGSETPLVYFDCSRHKPEKYDPPAGFDGGGDPIVIYAFEKLREGVSVASGPEDLEFVNRDKFQVMHAGLDDDYGNLSAFSYSATGTNLLLFPEGPFTGVISDNLTNFAGGEIVEEQTQ